MLAALLNVPNTEHEWAIWSLNNRDALDQIRQAIQAATGRILPVYQVDPIPFNDIDSWMDANQQAHIDFTDALGQQSSDLLHADLKNPNERQAWIWLNYKEIQDACNILKIGP